MKHIGRLFAFLLAAAPGLAEAQGTTAFFVAIDGNDASPGTIDAPFRTLQRARDAVRGVNVGMASDIHVYVRGGRHVLTGPLPLTAQDSGRNGFSVIWEAYQGEDAILSGETVVTGWVQDGANWRAAVGNVDSRTLFVNGARADRAHSDTNMGLVTQTPDGYVLPAGSPLPSWGNPDNIELVARFFWKEYRCGVASISPAEVVVDQPCWADALSHVPFQIRGVTWVENARELIDQPGEWYLDRSAGQLYYRPRPGDVRETAVGILPTVEQLVVGAGTAEDKIRNITFRNLIFAYTTWLRPNTPFGFPEVIANLVAVSLAQPPAAVALTQADGVVFEGNLFTRLGTPGLSFGPGGVSNEVVGNHFYDISSSALFLGHVNEPDLVGNVVENNYVHRIGAEYHGAAALWVGNTKDTMLRHNEIHDVPYDGVSIGFAWTFEPNGNGGNKVLNNLIYDHVNVMYDGGGIYSLGPTDPRNEYAYNVIRNQRELWGSIYLDEGAANVDVHHNALLDSEGITFIAKGYDHDIHHNWWQNRSNADIWFFTVHPAEGYLFDDDVCYVLDASGHEWVPVDCLSSVHDNVEIETGAEVPPEILSGAGIEPQYQWIKGRVIPDCPALSIGDPSAPEGAGSVVFTVRLSCPVASTVTVSYATSGNTATPGVDFTPSSGTLSFAPGVTSRTLTVPLLADSLYEGVETFFVDLSNASGAPIARGHGVGTILEDDPAPTASVEDVVVMEGNAGTHDAVFLVTLSVPSALTTTVSYMTADGSATAPSDYTPASGVLTFAPGQTSRTATVAIVGDTVWEPEEVLVVNLGDPVNGTVGDGQAEIAIVDDELPLLSIGDAAFPEGPPASTGLLTVTLNAPRIVDVTVSYQTADCTASKESDYTPLSGTLTFIPGETSKSIVVAGIGDSTFEASETYLVELSAATEATIVDGRGQVTLVNDDPDPAPPLGLPPADFDGDGKTDILWRHETSGQLAVWFMEGVNLTSGTIFDTLADLSWKVVGTADFDADGKTDILWRHDVSGQLAFWFMDGIVRTGGVLIPGRSDTSWKVVGTGDFDADGKPDILWRNDASGSLEAWLMSGTTVTTQSPLSPGAVADLAWRVVGTGDFNHDGESDLLWRHQGSGQLVAWLMDGLVQATGLFLTPSNPADANWQPSAAGDFNGDGHTDILFRHQVAGQLVVWLMNGTTQACGVFTNPDQMADSSWRIVGPH